MEQGGLQAARRVVAQTFIGRLKTVGVLDVGTLLLVVSVAKLPKP
jgi:hypothetical protein